MLIIKKASDLQAQLKPYSTNTRKTGFVPTMGALHRGHLTLIEKSIAENDLTICSIFINPTQFNDPNDFKKYPVTIESDINLLENAGCDILYLPSVSDIYPNGTALDSFYDLGHLENVFEGKYRKGHFQGVCQVVDRLLEVTNPTSLYLGQKDYQQCMVLSKLVQLKNFDCTINICPTQREANGLAMSSRNLRLSDEARDQASIIFKVLEYARKNYLKLNPDEIKTNCTNQLKENGCSVDYFDIADAETLIPVTVWNEHQKTVALVAAFIEEIRLIDNMRLN